MLADGKLFMATSSCFQSNNTTGEIQGPVPMKPLAPGTNLNMGLDLWSSQAGVPVKYSLVELESISPATTCVWLHIDIKIFTRIKTKSSSPMALLERELSGLRGLKPKSNRGRAKILRAGFKQTNMKDA
ncbi:hypothetical protein YC2023_088222 [Brassica napus]